MSIFRRHPTRHLRGADQFPPDPGTIGASSSGARHRPLCAFTVPALLHRPEWVVQRLSEEILIAAQKSSDQDGPEIRKILRRGYSLAWITARQGEFPASLL